MLGPDSRQKATSASLMCSDHLRLELIGLGFSDFCALVSSTWTSWLQLYNIFAYPQASTFFQAVTVQKEGVEEPRRISCMEKDFVH